MAKRVLVAVDGSPQSTDALEYALKEYPEADITALHVIDPVESGYAADPMGVDYWEGWYEDAQGRADDLLSEVEEAADDAGVSIATATETGPPARTIVEYAEEHGFDQVIVGSHGRRGMARILLGSVAESVVRRSTVPVTVVR